MRPQHAREQRETDGNKESKADGRWSWMNAVSGFLAGGFLALGMSSALSGELPSNIDLVPLMPAISIAMLAGGMIGGAAQMGLPDGLHPWKRLPKPVHWLGIAVLVALSIALTISMLQYIGSVAVPPGWELPDW